MADGLEHGVTPAQLVLGALAADCGGDDARRGAEGVGLGGAPLALVLAVLEAR